MPDRYYIAYGSNLSREQMKHRAPGAEIAGTGVLTDWRLLFRQYATIKKCRGFNVPVVIWRTTEQDERNLDRYEGYPKHYTKRELQVKVEGLGEITAMAYIMTAQAAKSRSIPNDEYFDLLKECYDNFGFDTHLLYEAIREAIDILNKNNVK